MCVFSKLTRKICYFSVVSILMAGWTLNASADEVATSGEWEKYVEAYLWAPRLYIKTTAGSHISMSLKDIIRNLDMLAMIDLGARKDKWSFATDSIYFNLGKKITREGSVLPGDIDVKLDMRAFTNTTRVGYRIGGDYESPVNLFAGVRYLYLRVSPEFDKDNIGDKEVLKTGHNWSGIVGYEGRNKLNNKWYINYYADIGTGRKTEVTWQAKIGAGYHFNKFTGTFGFRYLRWQWDTSSDLANLRVIGPYFGARWTF